MTTTMMRRAVPGLAVLCLLSQLEGANAQLLNGNCICEGRGELIPDFRLTFLEREGVADYVPASLLPNPTCGEIQAYYANASACGEMRWLSFCCTGSPPQEQCAQQVRNQILDGYDKISIPSKSLLHDPVTVSAEMMYHTITGINEAQGWIEIFVELTLRWNDHRLAWDYDDAPNSTCTALPVNARAQMQQGLKDSEIWVPEFDLFNQLSGVKGMTGPLANVQRDGNVTWRRLGRLKAICQMENLGHIPYDNLVCQLLMGSESIGVVYQLDPSGGLKVSNYAGPYNGYRLAKAEPGHVGSGAQGYLFYNLEYTRGTRFYTQNVIVPVALFSYCSLLTMVVGVGAFQTLALNFTLLLTTVTQKISTARLLPVTNEQLWLVDFVFGSFYFIVFTLAETFFKFIVLQMREEVKKEEAKDEGDDPEEADGDPRVTRKSYMPAWFFTFSTRRMDVICCWLGVIVYSLFLIVFMASRDNWGNDVQFNHVTNETQVGTLRGEL